MQLSHDKGKVIAVDLHNVALVFRSPDDPLCEYFSTVYGHLPRPGSLEAGIRINWRLHYQPMAPQAPRAATTIVEGDLVSYFQAGESVIIRMPRYGLIEVDLPANRMNGVVTQNCLEVYGAFEDVMLIALAPLYRRRSWFPIHAFAAQSPAGRVALITGAMGSGKTTTGLALLSAGWKLLSNDSPLLAGQAGAIQVLAYPGRLSAFDDSLARFAELRHFIPTQLRDRSGGSGVETSRKRQKRVFRAEEAFTEPWAAKGPAGGVFFPEIVPGLDRSELVDVPASEAVLKLMPQAIEGWDKAVIGQNLHLLSQLVDQVPCYVLRLAPQVEALPALLEAALNRGGPVPQPV